MRFKATLCILRQFCATLNKFWSLIRIQITIQTYTGTTWVYGVFSEIEINIREYLKISAYHTLNIYNTVGIINLK